MPFSKTDTPSLPKTFPILAPSILSADFANLGTQLRQTWRAGIRWIHLDIMDRHFVPNLTFGAPIVRSLRPIQQKFYFDAHLMVDNPRDQFEDFAQAGCQSITFHYEVTGDQTEDAINEIRNLKMAVGLAIKPKTPVAAISKFLRQVDLVLVMTVEPGFGGQKLLPNCLEKVRDLSRLRTTNNYNFLIQVDGGINTETIQLASSSGSDVLVAGQAIYNGQPISQNVLQLQELMKHS